MNTVLTEEIRKARKDHKCIWCGEIINAKDNYKYLSLIFEKKILSSHYHLECYDAQANSDFDYDDEVFFVYGYIRGTNLEK